MMFVLTAADQFSPASARAVAITANFALYGLLFPWQSFALAVLAWLALGA